MNIPCETCEHPRVNADLRAQLDLANAKAEQRFDCHGDPRNCGACVSCLLRDLEASQAEIRRKDEALEAADSLVHLYEWCSLHSKPLDVLVTLMRAPYLKYRDARKALAPKEADRE